MNRDIHKAEIIKRLAEESKLARESVLSDGDIGQILYAGGKAARLDVAKELIKDTVFVEDNSVARDMEGKNA